MIPRRLRNYGLLCWPILLGLMAGLTFYGGAYLIIMTSHRLTWDPVMIAVTSFGFFLMAFWYFLKGQWALRSAGREHGGVWRVLGLEREEFERLLAAQHEKRKDRSNKER